MDAYQFFVKILNRASSPIFICLTTLVFNLQIFLKSRSKPLVASCRASYTKK